MATTTAEVGDKVEFGADESSEEATTATATAAATLRSATAASTSEAGKPRRIHLLHIMSHSTEIAVAIHLVWLVNLSPTLLY